MTVALRVAAEDELAWLLALAGSDAVEPYLSTDAAAGLPAARAAGELLVAEAAGRRVGAVRAVITNRRSRIAHIRTLMVEPAERGRGLAVAIVDALLSRLVVEDDVHRVEAEVYGFNAAGLRVFAAAGFARDGVRRRAYLRHGHWQDGVIFGWLADEP